jgi:hypothetical protein
MVSTRVSGSIAVILAMLAACSTQTPSSGSPGPGAPGPGPDPGPLALAPLGSPRILVSDAATQARLRTALTSGAASAKRFKSIVDGQLAGADYWGFAPWQAALMGQLTGEASYCRWAVDETERRVQAEETLIARHQRATVADDSYLEVGGTIGSLAMVYDWCRAQTTSAQRTRWVAYGNQAVWNVWNHGEAAWGGTVYSWSGWAVDDPSNNYYYSFLRATMLLGLATHGENDWAQNWLGIFRTEKIANQLVPAFTRDLQGGGSREGTGYGTSMGGLFDIYYLWEKSTGDRVADLTPHALASLDKALHDIVPTLDRIAPTGDHARESTAALFDYHRQYIETLSRLYPADPVAGVSKTLLAQSSVPEMANGFEVWADFLYDQSDLPAYPLSRLPTAHWGSGTGQLSVRSAWTTDATYSNLICGPYTQSHAHRDQGSFVLFKGHWLAFDENIDSHSGLAHGEAAHNLVRIEKGGAVVEQRYDTSCAMVALADGPTYAYALARVTPVYAGNAAVRKVERELLFIKPGTLVVLDRVQTTGSGVARIWTLNLPVTPSVAGDGLSATNGGNRLDVVRLAPTGLASTVVSWPSVDSDMNGGSRVDVSDASGDTSVFLHVLGTDGAFSAAVPSDAPGQTGARITLASGSVATARFSTDGTGGTLEIRSPADQVTFTGSLPTDVQPPPRLAN